MKNNAFYALAIAIMLFSSCSSEPEKEENTSAMKPKSTIDITIVQAFSFANEMTVSGTILPNESVQLTTEAAGIVSDILFEEATYVKKGQLLVVLEHDDLKAELALLETQLKFANKNKSRSQQIFDEKGISEQELDNIVLQNQELEARKQIISAEIAKHKIVAPFSGKVGLRTISEGAYIGANTPITSLIDESVLKVEFSISEEHANQLKIGDSISFQVAGGINKNAFIYAKDAGVNASNRSLVFRAKYTNTEGNILAGSFSKVKVTIEQFENAVFIPNQAIIPELNGKKVYLYKNDVVHETKVESGIRKANFTHITSGVKAGDTLVTAGILQIRDSVPASIREIKTFDYNF